MKEVQIDKDLNYGIMVKGKLIKFKKGKAVVEDGEVDELKKNLDVPATFKTIKDAKEVIKKPVAKKKTAKKKSNPKKKG